MNKIKNVRIKSTIKNYEVVFDNNLKNLVCSLINRFDVHFLVDENVWNLYKKDCKNFEKSLSIFKVNAVEKNKTIKKVSEYVEFLLDNDVQKKHKIVVLGGGLVQDIGSFTAHIMKRGIDWVFVPTTLLSMVDSCIGSKSGINVGKYKNQVGSFHPPIEIYINTNFLRTLSDDNMINGIGEMIKHSLIKGEKSFGKLIKNIDRIDEKMVRESLLIKKEIVEEDELELGRRKLLNYGHTFGHALEGYTNNKIPHGMGVLIGMDMANFISFRRGLLDERIFLKIHSVINDSIGNHKVSIKDIDRYISFLKMDKKVVGDEVDAILCEGIGNIIIKRIKFDKELSNNINDYLKFKYDKSK